MTDTPTHPLVQDPAACSLEDPSDRRERAKHPGEDVRFGEHRDGVDESGGTRGCGTNQHANPLVSRAPLAPPERQSTRSQSTESATQLWAWLIAGRGWWE
jgi:hypothetical protein